MFEIVFYRIVILLLVFSGISSIAYRPIAQPAKQPDNLHFANLARLELLKRERALAEATISKNIRPYDEVLVEGFFVMEMKNKFLQRKDFISKLTDQNIIYGTYLKRNITIRFYGGGEAAPRRVYGDVVVVTYKLLAKGTNYGKVFNENICVNHVWGKQNGRWVLFSERHLEKCN